MLSAGRCENMVVISSTSNEWPSQKNNNQTSDGIRNLMMMSSTTMEKSTQDNQQQQTALAPPLPPPQTPLKCPRCDSSNTKFCYYNNYSLSQPRHFCKACKRYWTRGGTLRNVPVGGGCRKNKRIKKPSPPSISSSSSSSSSSLSLSRSSNPSSSMNPYPLIYAPSRVSGFEGNPIFDNMGLGFSTSVENLNPITSLLSDPLGFGSSFSSSWPLSSSLIASNNSNSNGFNGLLFSSSSGVKMEGVVDGQNKLTNNDNNNYYHQIISQMGQINTSSSNDQNHASISWNNNNGGGNGGGSWFDPSNIGSSSIIL